jgi:Helix-turn-helix domain
MPNWTTRCWQEFRARNLSRSARDILLTLATFRGRGGAIYPSHETLAERAKCSVRTVRRALMQARELGLVSWCERRVRVGWKWQQSSNSYRLAVPDAPVEPRPRPKPLLRLSTPGPLWQPREERASTKAALAVMMRAAAALPDLLALRREAFQFRQSGAQDDALHHAPAPG